MRSRFSTPAVVAHMLSDSVRAFNAIHDRVGRCETELAAKAGLDIRSPGFPSKSYSRDPVMGVRKFGPIIFHAFLSNIRITTFFESEVKIIDTSQISEAQGFGGEVEFNPATESEP